jgi:hypothetical protein
MKRRFERAMALLRQGDLSVTQVCRAVGYSSLGSFSSRFTERVGAPPSRYRRRSTSPRVRRRVFRPMFASPRADGLTSQHVSALAGRSRTLDEPDASARSAAGARMNPGGNHLDD